MVNEATQGQAGNSYQLPVRSEWLERMSEKAIEAALEIVDAHHHLLDHARTRYLVPEYLADLAGGHNVSSTVYVQARTRYDMAREPAFQPVAEVEFAAAAARESGTQRFGVCAAIVGCADLTLPAVKLDAVLDAMFAAANGRLRSIRNNAAWHADPQLQSNAIRPMPGLLRSKEFINGAAKLPGRDLTLDVWVYQTQLDEVFDLARQLPSLTVIVDHVGGPLGVGADEGRRQETYRSWKAAMERLALLPNVLVKLGGLGMRSFGLKYFERELPPSSAELSAAWQPWIGETIQMFGTRRCMFESNFPVDKGMCSYNALWNAFKLLARGLSEPEKADLFRLTATRAYRIQDGQ